MCFTAFPQQHTCYADLMLLQIVRVVYCVGAGAHVKEQLAPLGIAGGNVAARPSDLRKHLRGHPALERLRLLQFRGEDQGVETALVDDHSSGLIGRIANRDGAPIFLVYMLNNPKSRI